MRAVCSVDLAAQVAPFGVRPVDQNQLLLSTPVLQLLLSGDGIGRRLMRLEIDEPMEQLLALEDIVGCARIAAAQTSNAPIATNRISMAFVLI